MIVVKILFTDTICCVRCGCVCVADEMKDSMVSKVCAACEDMYGEALRALSRDSVRALWERDWLPAVRAKQASFQGLAQAHQAAVCRAAGTTGEEIARLQVHTPHTTHLSHYPTYYHLPDIPNIIYFKKNNEIYDGWMQLFTVVLIIFSQQGVQRY